MDHIEYSLVKRVSFVVNAVIALFVVLMTGIYAFYKVDYMVLHSIPTLAMYILFFWLIKKNKLSWFLNLLYIVIAIYMGAATICLGYNFGFHLYGMSMIPIAFYSEYLAYKMRLRKPKAVILSASLVVSYMVSTVYAVKNGPVYQTNDTAALIFLILNSIAVFGFLLFYTAWTIRVILNSEKQLEFRAHHDQLTGLYNRHFMMGELNKRKQLNDLYWIAIIDIDKFKHVNDYYGHGAGDVVLKELTRVMQETCKDCSISRWGGEEFLLVPDSNQVRTDLLERLRKTVERTSIPYEDQQISITISIGASVLNVDQKPEQCINIADEGLYESKNTGRNKVTWKS